MKVIVETKSGGSPFEIQLDYSDTVLMVKQKIEKSQRIPVSKQTLSFHEDGMPLRDELELHDIEKGQIFHGSLLHLFVSSDPNPNYSQTLIAEDIKEGHQDEEIMECHQEQSRNRVSNKKIVVHVSLYSRESSESSTAKKRIPVNMKRHDKVEELRKELVKLEENGEMNLPEEGYLLKHKGRLLREDYTFWDAGVNNNDAIEIFPRHLTHGIF
ncbi:unnamed protein product [Cochlearia groenlandica]